VTLVTGSADTEAPSARVASAPPFEGGAALSHHYDLIVVGGGIAGSSLAGRVAAAGASVLVLERERQFRDRVRGEWVAPWGVLELERLGALQVLRDRIPTHDLRFQNTGIYHVSRHATNLVERYHPARPALTFFHPEAQQALLTWAAEQGAEVIRGARATAATPGDAPAVAWTLEGESNTATARLLVGADGRTSLVRKALDREEHTRGEDRLWAGVRMRNIDWPDDTGLLALDPATGYAGAVFPQCEGAARVYLGPSREQRIRLSGSKDLPTFLEGLNALLGEQDAFANAEAIGPLATFDTEIRWVDRPAEHGLALIGDAAGYTDPTWGQGLSMGFRDARVLSDALLASEDWRTAADDYAAQHDRYFDAMAKSESWLEELLLAPGPDGDATRARAMGAWREDHTRNPEASFNGPDFDPTEEARRRFFALDLA
jgi:2-polyprenyl-6-methoxyphenol hydroxylase-like FAD-dependent oxidoreductase